MKTSLHDESGIQIVGTSPGQVKFPGKSDSQLKESLTVRASFPVNSEKKTVVIIVGLAISELFMRNAPASTAVFPAGVSRLADDR